VLFPTVEYALFFLGAFAASWALARRLALHKAFLLAASYAFYGFWDWRFLPVLLGLSLLAALVAQALELDVPARLRKGVLATGVTASLATLALFKYLGFGASALVALARALGLEPPAARLPEIALPVGISFFAFHAISLMVDAYRRRIPVAVKVLDALLYVAFFPQLVAGPILRAASFLPALAVERDPSRLELTRGLSRLAVGLVKKVFVAQVLASALVDPVFEAPAAHGALEALVAVYAYAVQIYCDFSGYSDMAIGSALLLGYAIPENFRAPYRADSPQDFWRRWHLSLSTWLRDYLFIPLGGSRGTPERTAVALAITMLLGGLWHGAAWTFVAWGAFHGAGLVVHRAWQQLPLAKALQASRAWSVVSVVVTFHFVCLGWVLFRAPSVGVATELLRVIASGAPGGVTAGLLLLVFVALATQWLPAHLGPAWTARLERVPVAVQGAAFAVLLLALDALGPRGVAPFIYFRF
jgi:D-alanyl-lipoteichoic acid acyltransferase DltB (MBOAT superfamily)